MCVCMYVHNAHRQTEQPCNCYRRGIKKGGRGVSQPVTLQGHFSESNLETVAVTMSVRAITMIVRSGQAATQTVVTLPGASQS